MLISACNPILRLRHQFDPPFLARPRQTPSPLCRAAWSSCSIRRADCRTFGFIVSKLGDFYLLLLGAHFRAQYLDSFRSADSTTRELFASLRSALDLAAAAAAASATVADGDKLSEHGYTEHRSAEALEAGVKSGIYVAGVRGGWVGGWWWWWWLVVVGVAGVRSQSLRHGFGPFFTHFSALQHLSRTVIRSRDCDTL